MRHGTLSTTWSNSTVNNGPHQLGAMGATLQAGLARYHNWAEHRPRVVAILVQRQRLAAQQEKDAMKKPIEAVVLPGYGCRSNDERLAAWGRRKQYRDATPTARFPLLIFKAPIKAPQEWVWGITTVALYSLIAAFTFINWSQP